MNTPVIQCRSIQKTFGEGSAQVQALQGVDLTIYEQELLMIVGPSGCGKTTLLSVMSGLLEADSGHCWILDEDMLTLSENEKARFRQKHIGFVFQSFNLFPALTALENIAVPLIVQGMDYAKAIQQAKPFLDSVGLSERQDLTPSQLSGGQQQRVAIARALVHHPKIVICDEPTSSLDHAAGQKVLSLLKNVAQQHQATLIIVTHDNRIYHFADRIAQMEDGRILKIEKDYDENI